MLHATLFCSSGDLARVREQLRTLVRFGNLPSFRRPRFECRALTRACTPASQIMLFFRSKTFKLLLKTKASARIRTHSGSAPKEFHSRKSDSSVLLPFKRAARASTPLILKRDQIAENGCSFHPPDLGGPQLQNMHRTVASQRIDNLRYPYPCQLSDKWCQQGSPPSSSSGASKTTFTVLVSLRKLAARLAIFYK